MPFNNALESSDLNPIEALVENLMENPMLEHVDISTFIDQRCACSNGRSSSRSKFSVPFGLDDRCRPISLPSGSTPVGPVFDSLDIVLYQPVWLITRVWLIIQLVAAMMHQRIIMPDRTRLPATSKC